MNIKSYRFWLIAMVLFFQMGFDSYATLQQNAWSEKKEVKVNPPKPGRKRIRPRPPTVPLLTVQYRILKRNKDLSVEETNPNAMFVTGDRFKVAIKVNQDGYLYIINRSIDANGAGAGDLIFPDSRINGGQNFVNKNQELTLPDDNCTQEALSDGKCWWWLKPGTAGREELWIIFSRDLITSLPNEAVQPGGVVSKQVLDGLYAESRQQIEKSSRPNLSPQQGGGAGRYAIWVQNKNRNDNEEIIFPIRLNHADRERSGGK